MGDLEMEKRLMKRFRDLEASQEKLREQLGFVLREGIVRGDEHIMRRRDNNNNDFDVVIIPGYFAKNPYFSVLQHIGHAIYVCRPITGEIIYWNHSAENLYGWNEYEALGQRVANLLIDDENLPVYEKVMERLNSGQTWSGQFPFRKRSGHMFMAVITKSPLYENNELIGVIAVSSDNAILNDMNKEKSNAYWNEANDQQRESKFNFGRLRPQLDIASSVSNLASKLLPRIHAYSNDEGANSRERCGCMSEAENVRLENRGRSASKTIFRLYSGLKAKEENYKYKDTISKFNEQSKIAGKLFSKLHIRKNAQDFQEPEKGIRTNSTKISEPDLSTISPHNCTGCNENNHKSFSRDSKQRMKIEKCCTSDFSTRPKGVVEEQLKRSSIKSKQCSEIGSSSEETRSGLYKVMKNYNISHEQRGTDDANHGVGNSSEGLSKHEQILQKRVEDCPSIPADSAGTNCSSKTGSSPDEMKDVNLATACDIRWEDLLVGEEVGQGSAAVVYRGVWNGSDVAIKVLTGNEYKEGLILDYKKEIAIMKRLRHPNVLLFMGAVYSPERLAIVTEFLPRGSLFRTLHKNSQKLDLKRRLRMTLDVARGMNYLHRRNPPIIHRDLKSSNLLVGRNWSVKVGDFGLSCLKIATVMTATTGKGTPQWMAPEVLRGECSNEKSDVFSFGVILWELMTESVPWSHLSPLQVIGVVGFMDQRLDLPANMDPRVSTIICDCWDSDPKRRPSFQELIEKMGELIGAVTPPLANRRLEHQMRRIAAE